MTDPNPSHLLAVIRELKKDTVIDTESLDHPNNTADCGTLALDHLAAISRVGALEAENTILKGYINGNVTWDKVEEILKSQP